LNGSRKKTAVTAKYSSSVSAFMAKNESEDSRRAGTIGLGLRSSSARKPTSVSTPSANSPAAASALTDDTMIAAITLATPRLESAAPVRSKSRRLPKRSPAAPPASASDARTNV
jgi:hypothetical protein